MAADMGVTYLGDIQLDPRLGQSCDAGKSFIQDYPDSNVSISYKKIIASKYHLVLARKIIIGCLKFFVTEIKDIIEKK